MKTKEAAGAEQVLRMCHSPSPASGTAFLAMSPGRPDVQPGDVQDTDRDAPKEAGTLPSHFTGQD